MMKTTDEDVDWAVDVLNQACRAHEAAVLLIDKSGALDEFDSSWKHTVVSNDEALYALRASIKKKRYEQAKPCKFTLNIKHKPYGRVFFSEDLYLESINVSTQEARGGNLTFPKFDEWVNECDSCLAASLKDPVRDFIVTTLRREVFAPFDKEATVAIPCPVAPHSWGVITSHTRSPVITLSELRYMERVPEMLNRIAQSINALAEAVEQLNGTIEHKLNQQQPKE